MSSDVAGVFHVVATVSDMDRALLFYRDTLGFVVTFDDFHESTALGQLLNLDRPEVRSVIVACPDGSEIELAEFQRPRGRPTVEREWADAGLSFLSLRVAHIEALIGRISAAGFTFTSELVHQTLPDGAVAKVVVCRGPDGVAVTLTELPADRTSLAPQWRTRSVGAFYEG